MGGNSFHIVALGFPVYVLLTISQEIRCWSPEIAFVSLVQLLTPVMDAGFVFVGLKRTNCDFSHSGSSNGANNSVGLIFNDFLRFFSKYESERDCRLQFDHYCGSR
jgi:hypothetical protein